MKRLLPAHGCNFLCCLLYVMPLGFLEFGPVLGRNLRRSPNLSVGFHVRIESLGLLSYVITENGDGYEPIR